MNTIDITLEIPQDKPITQDQRSYICYALRSRGMDKRIPNRMSSVTTKNGSTQQVNNVWLDLDAWLVANVSCAEACMVIAAFKTEGMDEEAFSTLVQFGMPVSK